MYKKCWIWDNYLVQLICICTSYRTSWFLPNLIILIIKAKILNLLFEKHTSSWGWELSCSLLQKVMHTRKRHMELFQELNQKFQTLDRFRDIPNTSSMVSMLCFNTWVEDAWCQILFLPSRTSLSWEHKTSLRRKKSISLENVLWKVYQDKLGMAESLGILLIFHISSFISFS